MTKLSFVCLMLSAVSCASMNLGVTTHTGTYSVPVAKNLEKLALFPLPHVMVNRQRDLLVIRYTLPTELTGPANEIEFRGPLPQSGPVLLTGRHGKMECPDVNDLAQCEVFYKDLNFDAKARSTILKSIAKDPTELKDRELVAMAFEAGGEPHGILTVNPDVHSNDLSPYRP